MADISISKSRGKKYLGGASPMVPAFIVGDDPIPLNPPGSVPTTLYKLLGDVTDSDFIGKNGFVPVVVGENVLTLQSLTTNVLSTPLTGYVVGANTAIDSSNTILTAFQQVQGQINARVSGTIASGQVAFGSGTNVISGESALLYDSANDVLTIGLPLLTSVVTNARLIINGNGTNESIALRNTATSGNTFTAFSLRGFNGVTFIPETFGAIYALNSTWSFGTGIAKETIYAGIYDLSIRSGNSKPIRFLIRDSDSSVTSAVEWMRLTNTGQLWIGTASGTNTLDVNGTARIRTISNGVGDFLTKSATGVITSRTAAELKSDISAIGGTIASGQVAFGSSVNTISGDNDIFWDNTLKNLGIGTVSPLAKIHVSRNGLGPSNQSLIIIEQLNAGGAGVLKLKRHDGKEGSFFITGSSYATGLNDFFGLFSHGTLQTIIGTGGDVELTGTTSVLIRPGGFGTARDNTEFFANGNVNIKRGILNVTGAIETARTDLKKGVIKVYGATELSAFNFNNRLGFTSNEVGIGLLFCANGTSASGGSETILFKAGGYGTDAEVIEIKATTLDFKEGKNILFGTTTGTKIGTATTQKLSFWNKTPIIQPTTAYASSVLVGLGGTPITDTDTFDGYTLKQIVSALRGIGLLA